MEYALGIAIIIWIVIERRRQYRQGYNDGVVAALKKVQRQIEQATETDK